MTNREQFEAWFSDGINEGIKVSASGGYENLITQTAWMAWQASRDAIEIKLPEEVSIDCVFGYYADDIVSAIESAGLKVKK